MIAWIHDHSANFGTFSEPARLSGFPELLVLMLLISDLSDGRHAFDKRKSKFTARHANVCVLSFFRHELGADAGRANKFSASAGLKFYVVNHRTDRNILHLHRVPGANVRLGSRENLVSDLHSGRSEDIPLLTVGIRDESYPARSVRIVLDRRNNARNSDFIPFEIDDTVESPSAAAEVTHRNSPGVVSTAAILEGDEQ